MKHRDTFLLGLASGIILLTLFAKSTEFGRSLFTEKQIQIDSSLYLAGVHDGRSQVFSSQKKDIDSQLVVAKETSKPARTRYEVAKVLPATDTTGLDSLGLIRALVEDNYKCREVVKLADTVIRDLEMQLILSYSRMNIDDSLEKSLLAERKELKNVIRLKSEQIEGLQPSWWDENKFIIGFVSGAAVSTAIIITAQ